jgi:hypothetical protein
LIRSCGSTPPTTTLPFSSFCGPRSSALKPSVFLPMRRSITRSRPTKAPPQTNRMLVVSTWKNSWCGCLRPPGRDVGDGAFEDLQQRLLDALAGHVAGDRGFSSLRQILSTSSM